MRSTLVLAAPLFLAACSMSVPMPGSGDKPAVTGSVSAPVQVQQPLPQTLAYSDATKIGQAAEAALWEVDKGPQADWINSATGSSGTVEGASAPQAEQLSGACRLFNTIVTSIGGVHSYTGKVCRSGDGPAVVQIDPETGAAS